jgi:hypothetical protein
LIWQKSDFSWPCPAKTKDPSGWPLLSKGQPDLFLCRFYLASFIQPAINLRAILFFAPPVSAVATDKDGMTWDHAV